MVSKSVQDVLSVNNLLAVITFADDEDRPTVKPYLGATDLRAARSAGSGIEYWLTIRPA